MRTGGQPSIGRPLCYSQHSENNGTCSLPGVSLDLMFTSAVLYVFCLLAIRFVFLGERVFVSWDRIGALLG